MPESKTEWARLMAALVLGATLGIVGITVAGRTRPAPIIIEPPPATATPSPTATARPLRVYVSGEVVRAAVYALPAGSIVADAIHLAGDFTAEAAVERVNLAQPLADGMQIHVPCRRAAEAPTETQGGVAAQPVIRVPTNSLTAETGSTTTPGGLVNINTAGLDELDTLPGVGPATAEKIVAHRELNGPFARIEDIMDVSGIGEAKFETMRDLITVGG